MAIYKCKIGSSDGRILEKEIEAVNTEILKQSLEEQGYFVFEIKKKPLQFLLESGITRRKVDNKDLLTFNQELLVLIKAGLPIIQALDTILERVEKGKLGEILSEIREDVKGGAALSVAFEKHPKVFPHLYIASIQAGERTGDLPQTIRRYIAFLKKAEGFRKKVLSALVYPAIVITVAFVAVTLLLVYVVPTFSQVYADSGSSLPVPTQMLIAFTGILKKFFWAGVGLFILAIFIFRRWAETERGRYRVDALLIKVPFIGQLLIKYAVSSFMRTLATVLGSGIPIIESLKMSVGTLNNMVLERKLLEAVVRVEEGVQLSTALEGAKIMPPLALRMLGVGETTGSLEEMLGDISDYFEEEIERHLNVLTTSIEPAIMIIMGVVIGVIIVTMYLPIFKIAGTVG
ncbi:type II secretion system F family protein [Geotalea uraniireducens]|uniref:Type II secretion system protein n=1 Tax=Geotalea uraniireducens (strain Rf4) TaxID=351605 RepID=A5GFA8_GEOUR|nr:type II secretion system F family protein [Geotalea uraniireducens]ABQ26113.1 type II secretion system protein [Geotalea uraniireducens Rf4]